MSAESNARAEASQLKAVMQRWGVRCSIELQAGRNGAWIVPKYLRMHHHTATRPSQGATPALGIVKTGRPDVPGPLANGYGGYDLVFRIITMGLANHPGQGGPIIIDGVAVPRDSMRSPSFGVEWEGGYEEWTPQFLEFMGRADNALAEWMRRPDTSQLEHKTWAPTRKIDRYKFTRERGMGLTRMWSDQEEDMTPDQAKTLDNVAERLIRMEKDLTAVHKRAPGYFAKDPAATDSVVYYVDAAHQSKVSMSVGGKLHELLKFFHAGAGHEVRAVTLETEVLASIPDAA